MVGVPRPRKNRRRLAPRYGAAEQMSLHRTFVLREQHIEPCVAFIRSNAPAMALAGTPLSVTITEHKAKRTIEQNARLHAILADIAAHAWVDGRQYDVETWKEYFRQKFIGTEEIILPGGKRIERGISTTTLSVGDFSAFMDQVEEYAVAQLGVEFA